MLQENLGWLQKANQIQDCDVLLQKTKPQFKSKPHPCQCGY